MPVSPPSSPVEARTPPDLRARLTGALSAVLKGLGVVAKAEGGGGGNPNHDARGRFASHAGTKAAKLVGGQHHLDPKATVVFTKESHGQEVIGGTPFAKWAPGEDWHANTADLVKPDLVEPPLDLGKGWTDSKDGQHYAKHAGAGVLVQEPDGRVWVVEPKDHYGGYRNTFPKGTQDEGLSLQETAIKEAYEESGLKVKITGLVGDYERSTSVARYYTAVRVGGTPTDHGWETQAVKLVPPTALTHVLNRSIDRHIAKVLDPTIDVTPPKPKYEHTYSSPKSSSQGSFQLGPGDNPWNKPKKPSSGPVASGTGGNWTTYASMKAAEAKAKESAKQSVASHAASLVAAADAKAATKAPSNPGEAVSPATQPTAASEGVTPANHAYDASAGPLPVKPADAATILHQKVAGAGGSNPGGVYHGADGKRRYVKFYSDPTQAHGEHLANEVYRALDLAAPQSQTFDHNGKTAYASELLPEPKTLAKTGLTPDRANEILRGFAADVLTGNWDAVGTGHDNIVYAGKSPAPIRVDNGGTFLHRAQAGRKPEQFLNAISEYAGLAAPTVNPYYAKVFQAAGHTPDTLPSFKAQVAKIDEVEKQAGGWASFVGRHAPGLPPQDATKVVKMLQSRHALLREKAAKHV